MNKEQFFKELNHSLQTIPEDERQDMIHDFEEHFSFALAEGKTEEDIAASLGAPRQIAKELNASYHLEQVETKATTGNVFRAVWAAIGLSFFNLIIVLGPFIGLGAIVLGGWVVGVVFTLSPFLVLVNAVIYPETFVYFDLFFSFILSGLGLLIAVVMFYVTRKLSNWFIKYLHYNIKLIKGGLKHD